MKSHAVLLAAAAALATLAGCSGKEESTDAAPAADSSAAAPEAAAAERASPEESAANQEAMVQTLSDKLKPGLWKLRFTVTSIDAPDAPEPLRAPLQSLKGTTQEYAHCLPADQAGRPDPEFFGNDTNSDCSYDKFSQSGDFTTISMTCGGEGGRRMRTDMQGELKPESFELAMANQVLNSPNGKIKLAGKLTGTRTGSCEG
ncbi:DUF3617 domain-containing protein [Novosphingopyxis sp. YJ-S2-01]|uniref:DUF3617 domain-containing protein n=1 Tax=Novosphingopyxis sp. YJ-S2-01 TaxID=2794021 RepID=UPI0018DEA03F|nr:DUF3617 family protein [Novosphingopyxis sp. YJ-S2-01]MBH9536560.1 DUF3617 family protein [Novosphingopyxis sp. YJ-S2-01]